MPSQPTHILVKASDEVATCAAGQYSAALFVHTHRPGAAFPSGDLRSKSTDHARIGPARSHGREPADDEDAGRRRARTYTSSFASDGLSRPLDAAADPFSADFSADFAEFADDFAFSAFSAARSVPSGSVRSSEAGAPAASSSSNSVR